MSDSRPILLATDGSPSAAEAQREAFELARALDAPLLVVAVAHVVLPTVGYASYGYSNLVAELTETERERVEALLHTVASEAEAAGVRCTTMQAEGVAVEEICRIAAERDVRMIVAGSHGFGAGKRLLFGSVSTSLLHQAPCPVLVAHGPDPEPAGRMQAA